jgi:hypothetical protein
MVRLVAYPVAALVVFVIACSGSAERDDPRPSSSTPDAGSDGAAGVGGTGSGGATGAGGAGGASTDAGVMEDGGAGAGAECSVDGNPGQCMEVSACAALADHSSTPGYCPGPADIECCTLTPSTADNPPIPTGYELMPQADVTAAMTAWAVAILDDPAEYPMFATAMMTFGTLMVLARVEWHPPDFQNAVVHRGVTLYEPI